MTSYGLDGVDVKLLKYLNYSNGVFIEAGANDGITQNNTLLLEHHLNWRGILIEPNIPKFQQCAKNRPNAIVENFALVSDNYELKTIKGDFIQQDWGVSLSGMVQDSGDWTDEHIEYERNKKAVNDSQFMIEVPVTTLTNLLIKHNFTQIDFFCLDVEGYEISVLGGLDFSKFRPKYIMIETTTSPSRREGMNKFMSEKNYHLIDEISINDCLYKDSTLV